MVRLLSNLINGCCLFDRFKCCQKTVSFTMTMIVVCDTTLLATQSYIFVCTLDNIIEYGKSDYHIFFFRSIALYQLICIIYQIKTVLVIYYSGLDSNLQQLRLIVLCATTNLQLTNLLGNISVFDQFEVIREEN